MHTQAILAQFVRSGAAITKTGVTRALREAGVKVSAALAAASVDAADDIRSRIDARSRPRRRGAQSLGAFAWADGRKPAQPPRRMLDRPLAQRLTARREEAIRAASPMREGAAGGSSVTVTLTGDPSEVHYKVVTLSNRDTYRGRFKGWAATEDHHYITVPADWRTRVQARGLADLSGLFTLDAQALETPAPEGVVVYRATWAAQGRGYSVTTHRGYIAHHADDGAHFHADTAAGALAGLTRKMGRRALEIAAPTATSDFAEWARARAAKGARVRVSDARRIGACEYGIRSWCHRVGLPYEAGSAPIGSVIAAYIQEPQREARGAILEALKRSATKGKAQ